MIFSFSSDLWSPKVYNSHITEKLLKRLKIGHHSCTYVPLAIYLYLLQLGNLAKIWLRIAPFALLI